MTNVVTTLESSTAGASQAASAEGVVRRGRAERPWRFLGITGLAMALALGGIWQANRAFAPEMYKPGSMREVAEALNRNQAYGVFDLNINIRELRDHQLALMPKAPDVVLFGASHWQEAHAGLVTHRQLFNAHVHRDYYEDVLGMSEMLVRHDKLPKTLIISIRDKQFTPLEMRTDYLWLPIVPYYRAMARRLGVKEHGNLEALPVQRWREQLSLSMLHTNVVRWFTEPVKPHAMTTPNSESLDALMPDGSILWSGRHKRLYTADRTRQMALEFAAAAIKSPPVIDPKGVAKVDAMLAYLRARGVELYFVHPPFNPDFFERVKGTRYMTALAEVEQLTQRLAAKHGAKVFGSFDPAKVGCRTRMFIDAEHSSPECLGKVFAEFVALDQGRQPNPAPAPVAPAAPAIATTPEGVRNGVSEARVAGATRTLAPPVAAVPLDQQAAAAGGPGLPYAQAPLPTPAPNVAALSRPQSVPAPRDTLRATSPERSSAARPRRSAPAKPAATRPPVRKASAPAAPVRSRPAAAKLPPRPVSARRPAPRRVAGTAPLPSLSWPGDAAPSRRSAP